MATHTRRARTGGALAIVEARAARSSTPTGDFEGGTGVPTSGIVATKDRHQIALSFTGQKHAGESLSDLLARRNAELSASIQMCDSLFTQPPRRIRDAAGSL